MKIKGEVRQYNEDEYGDNLAYVNVKIFYGEKRKGFHPHPLMLRVRQSWKCDVCQRTFADKCSFFCQQCDFDACDQCYLAY